MSRNPRIPSNFVMPAVWVPTPDDVQRAAQVDALDAEGLRSPTNSAISHWQRVRFVTKPLEYGKTYVGYYHRSTPGLPLVQTWTGEMLAMCFKWTDRRAYNSYVTNARGSFWAQGIDGRIYYGRHNGHGMWCTMRLAKHQPTGQS